MTNAEIIYRASVELMEQGVIGTAGYMPGEDQEGNPVQVPIPEVIHTFNGWKQLGYIVRKGEHAVAEFHIWKWKAGPHPKSHGADDGDADGEADPGRMFKTRAWWFTASQVQPIKA